MHPLVLLTALTATTGLFGGGRAHRGYNYSYAPAASCSSCSTGYSYQSYYYQAPATCQQGTPAAAPAAPQPAAVPTQQPVSQPPQAQARNAYYYNPTSYYSPMSSCPGGNCYRR